MSDAGMIAFAFDSMLSISLVSSLYRVVPVQIDYYEVLGMRWLDGL